MEIINYDEEIKEILIEDIIKSNDKGKIIIKGEKVGKSGEHRDDLTKELAAYDSMNLGPSKSSEIHSVPVSSASKYSDGKDISDDDTRSRVLGVRHNIADKAVAQLMDTLNLFDPTAIEKQTDIIKSAAMLASIVEKVTVNSNRNGGNEVHLHLYGPKQNKIDKYEVIDI